MSHNEALGTAHFYRNLPVISSFAEATEGRSHAYVPPDWWIVIADVVGSTQAIESGIPGLRKNVPVKKP